MTEDLVTALVNLKEEEALKRTETRLSAGDDPLEILEDSRKALDIIGKRFEVGEYFVPDLVYSGEILKEITQIVKPKLAGGTETKRLGKVVIGTVSGDVHDIGKNIVSFLLDVSGFEVYDLGVDVPTQKFVDMVEEVNPDIVGLSGLLTLSFSSMKDTVDAIGAAGLRDKVKIMIGGCLVDERIREYAGADAYRPDAAAAVSLAREWVGGN